MNVPQLLHLIQKLVKKINIQNVNLIQLLIINVSKTQKNVLNILVLILKNVPNTMLKVKTSIVFLREINAKKNINLVNLLLEMTKMIAKAYF